MKLFCYNFASRNQLNNRFMKNVICTVLLIATTLNVFALEQNDSNPPESIRIEVDKKMTQTTSPQERGLVGYDIEAYLYSDLKYVEVYLCDIGDAYVSIVDVYGTLVDYVYVDSETPMTIALNVASGCGDYYLVISSPVIYAEGCFHL